MIDELKLRKAMERASKAKAVLENELLMETFAGLEQDYMAKWRTMRTVDFEGREACWHAVQALVDIKAKIQALVNDGQVAARELKDAGL